jgi:integration host factor subunit alpha
MALTKSDLIEEISEHLNLSPAQTKSVLETLLETMKSTLASGEDVLLSGFGKLLVKDKAPRRGRNPATGEDLILPKRRVVTFKCSGKLRDQISQNDLVEKAELN